VIAETLAHNGVDVRSATTVGSLFSGCGGHDLVTAVAYHQLAQDRWGPYEVAVRRWESLTRSTPSPNQLNSKGNPRLTPSFSEWLMGWPAGWVTDVEGVDRRSQMRICGNGVVPQQAYAALATFTHVAEEV
jgi:DNA (cytosine-5)-methyltransferase 1